MGGGGGGIVFLRKHSYIFIYFNDVVFAFLSSSAIFSAERKTSGLFCEPSVFVCVTPTKQTSLQNCRHVSVIVKTIPTSKAFPK